MKVLALALPSVLAVPHAHHGHVHEHTEAEAEIEHFANQLSVSRELPAASAQSFSISAVKLAPDSLFGIAQHRNQEFQLSLNDTQWLCQMTSASNLTSCHGKCVSPPANRLPPLSFIRFRSAGHPGRRGRAAVRAAARRDGPGRLLRPLPGPLS